MNRWLVLPVLALLTACVSYYQPESALEDGVYYPEDDPAYRYNTDDYYYSRVVVYPWSSLDSFYFGYWPYSSYAFGYWPYSGYGFSFVYPDEPGFAVGYYAFYSPWYSRAYSTYYYPPAWRPYRNNCHHHGRCGEHGNDGDAGDGRYAAEGGQNNGYPGGGGEENAFYSNNVRNKMGQAGYPPTNRYVLKSPADRTGYQGLATQNQVPAKAGKSRSRPVYPTTPGAAIGRSASGGSAPSGGAFTGHSRQSPSFNPPSRSHSSDYGKSSRQKDRD